MQNPGTQRFVGDQIQLLIDRAVVLQQQRQHILNDACPQRAGVTAGAHDFMDLDE
ncbi:hypothetical protein D3C73_1639040 [compost metagenome]